jgi:hypothetical protein
MMWSETANGGCVVATSKGGGRRAPVGDRRRAAAAQALGVSVEEKRTLDAANERAHELFGLGVGVLVFEAERFRDLAESLDADAARIGVGWVSPTWRRLHRQAKAARADAALWDERLAAVARDLAERQHANVAASPGER